MKLPRIGITIGDPAGIGPEIVVAMLLNSKQPYPFVPILFASRAVLDHPFLRAMAQALSICWVTKAQDCQSENTVYAVDCASPGAHFPIGKANPDAGLASARFIQTAVKWAMAGAISGIVTAPICKFSWSLAGIPFVDHTTYLQSLTQSPYVSMGFYTPQLKVVLATVHTPYSRVPSELTMDRLQVATDHAIEFSRRSGCPYPKIALAGLNPHAGEEGLLGDEERVLLRPFVSLYWSEFGEVVGPFPADSIFRRALAGEFDCVVALYHDQGLIPLKLIGDGSAVNTTLGLPFVRTSPDHGSAFDIAYTGKAKWDGLYAALQLAVEWSILR